MVTELQVITNLLLELNVNYQIPMTSENPAIRRVIDLLSSGLNPSFASRWATPVAEFCEQITFVQTDDFTSIRAAAQRWKELFSDALGPNLQSEIEALFPDMLSFLR